MQLTLDNGEAFYKIQSYQNGIFKVNNQTYSNPIIVSPNQLTSPWRPASLKEIQASDLELVLPHKPQLVLLGTGSILKFPAWDIFIPLIKKQIGFEVMDTAAACRTYTLLMAEGRAVTACLLN